MFHHFPGEEDVGQDCLVRSTDFTYSYEEDPTDARNPIFSFLLSVTQSGYKRQPGGYFKKSLPPLEFAYTASRRSRRRFTRSIPTAWRTCPTVSTAGVING